MATPVQDGPPQARFSWSRMRSIARMSRDSATFPPQRKSRSTMSYVVREWLNLAVRWTHVFAAVMWVGQTYFFTWLDHTFQNEKQVWTVLSYLLLVGAIVGVIHLFASRAAYMQIGATLGSFMALNVWVRILPAQRQLIAAVKAGNEPDMRLADLAKQRSKQNTFIVLPVVFIMISSHFPVATYGNQYNWLVLAVLVLVGWGVAKVIRTR